MLLPVGQRVRCDLHSACEGAEQVASWHWAKGEVPHPCAEGDVDWQLKAPASHYQCLKPWVGLHVIENDEPGG